MSMDSTYDPQIQAQRIQLLIEKGRALLRTETSPYLYENIQAFIDAATAKQSTCSALFQQWSGIEAILRARSSADDDEEDFLPRRERFGLVFMCILFLEYVGGEASQRAIVASDIYIKMCGGPDQRRYVAQRLTNGDELKLMTMFERQILATAKKLSIDPDYVRKRYQKAAEAGCLLDSLSRQEQLELIQKDLNTIEVLAGFEETSKYAAMVMPRVQHRYATLGKSPSLFRPLHIIETAGMINRKTKQAFQSGNQYAADGSQSVSTSIEIQGRTSSLLP